MSTCSACLRGAAVPPRASRGSSSKNLPKKSSKRLPPPSGDPPKSERSALASYAWISHRCKICGGSPGTIRLIVTTAGLIPQTSHILVVAIFFCLLLSVTCHSGHVAESVVGAR